MSGLRELLTLAKDQLQTMSMDKTARRVLRRHLLKQLLPQEKRRTKVAIYLTKPLPTLWFENEAGDQHVPDLTGNMPPDVPEGFIYQRSRFPRTLVDNCLRLVTEEDVSKCDHKEVLIDHGLIDGLEGRICRDCGGSQTKNEGEPWPAVWKSGGSQQVFSGSSSYPSNLVLAMVRPSEEEMGKAAERGHNIIPMSYDQAVLVAATSCERCLNVLLWRHGLGDGYEEGSPEWEKANTSCELCKDEFPPKPISGPPAVEVK